MRVFALLVAVASLAVATASTSLDVIPEGAVPVTAPTDMSLNKRDFCLFGMCIGIPGVPDYLNDVNNWFVPLSSLSNTLVASSCSH